MKTVKFFNSVMEASLAESLLKANGIENAVLRRGLDIIGDTGDSEGADLYVAEKDLIKARRILEIDSD